uniref:Integrase catalytic domain-containing protein n=1 Tax=Gasterosteus aculeatus aculeatus TaxID=481459 RepID=A0AAQ4QLX3_GASAC
MLLANTSGGRAPPVCVLPGVSVSEHSGHSEGAVASSAVGGGPVRADRHGPHRAVSPERTRISLCVGPHWLRNAVSGGSAAAQHLCKKRSRRLLFQVISRVGIPKEILTDQGTSFLSRTLRELYRLLGIKSFRTSVYHPQTDGLERMNKTLKSMIRKFISEDERNWDHWLDPLLFAVREVPQASTGFSPFELWFGRGAGPD